MSAYSIKDLEQLSGIKAHTIRIWEQRHNLFSPQRTDTNIRFYNEDDLKLILNISLLRNHGIKISKIVSMTSAQLHEEVFNVGSTEHTNEDQLNALTLAMLEMDETLFNTIFQSNQEKLGFEATMTEIIYPFFRKIGLLWTVNSIYPAQEHFITHLVRQKLIIETEKLDHSMSGPVFLLFLPEEELHELSLLYANYILRKRGFKTFYFGQSLPTRDLEEAFRAISPDYFFTILTSKPPSGSIQEYLNTLGEKFSSISVYVTGSQVVNQGLTFPNNLKLINQFSELEPILRELGILSLSK